MAELTPEVAATSDRPVVALDIDGVIQLWDGNATEGFIPNPVYPWFLHNPAHGAWLRQITDLADIHYISHWGSQSHAIAGQPLELPELDWINNDTYARRRLPNGHTDYAHARTVAITALFGERPVAWLDDEVGSDEFAWAAARDQEVAPTLLIRPDGNRGLEPEHLATISRWLETVIAK